MAVLDIYLVLVFVIGVSSRNNLFEPPPCYIQNARSLPIYDLNITSLNVLEYDDIFESVLGNKYYQFDDVEKKAVGGMFYGNYPVLVVYQPDENINELHGYYYPLPWGLKHLYDTHRFSSEIIAKHLYNTHRFNSEIVAKHQSIHDFLNSPFDKEGFTPAAALQMYPELKKYKLTKIIDNAEKQSPVSGCAVLFVFPKKDSRKSKEFENKYKLFEEYYYNSFKICRASDSKPDDGVSDAEDDDVPLWTVFGHKKNSDEKENNMINFHHVEDNFSNNSYYQFNKFDQGFSNYSQNPTLIVLQPDEKVPELHGYYFSGGIQSLISYIPFSSNEVKESFKDYKPLFDYVLNEAFLDGITPSAARFDYPYFLDYKLTKFVHAEDVAGKFAVMFLAPSKYRPARFEEKYYAFEDYGIHCNGIVNYLAFGAN